MVSIKLIIYFFIGLRFSINVYFARPVTSEQYIFHGIFWMHLSIPLFLGQNPI